MRCLPPGQPVPCCHSQPVTSCDGVCWPRNKLAFPFNPNQELEPASMCSSCLHVLFYSTWPSRWTCCVRWTSSMQECTSSWTRSPRTWSRATRDWCRTTAWPSRRSTGQENRAVIRASKNQFQRLCLALSFSFFQPSSLTETIEGLQTYMEDLQAQVEELQSTQLERSKRELAEQRRSIGSQSVSCLKELYNVHQNRCAL